jgi:hypothetical protein
MSNSSIENNHAEKIISKIDELIDHTIKATTLAEIGYSVKYDELSEKTIFRLRIFARNMNSIWFDYC